MEKVIITNQRPYAVENSVNVKLSHKLNKSRTKNKLSTSLNRDDIMNLEEKTGNKLWNTKNYFRF